MEKIRLSDKIIREFHSSWKMYDKKEITHAVEKGGRASSKSTTIECKLVLNRMKTKTHAVCCRKWGKTLRTTVRNNLIWAIKHLGVQDYWEWRDGPSADQTLIYKPTHTKIFFEGADGDKIKGWKTHDFPTTDVFFEEITDFKTDEELTSIVLSILRQKLPVEYKYTFFYAYNPPKRKSHWANKKYNSHNIPNNTYVHHSDYRTNPHLPKEFHIEAEQCKKDNLHRYEWEFLGKPIGSGVVPFDNLTFREITDKEVAAFDNIRQGNDWGYAVDPNAFVRWHYDSTRLKIYALDEIYQVKLSNRELVDKLKSKGYDKLLTVADSAEPKSISQVQELGCRFEPAKKGAGSVESGEKWLDDLVEIVIDPSRTPNIAKEFENAEYDTDRYGNTLSRLKDQDNHAIDATRYAFETDMSNQKWGW